MGKSTALGWDYVEVISEKPTGSNAGRTAMNLLLQELVSRSILHGVWVQSICGDGERVDRMEVQWPSMDAICSRSNNDVQVLTRQDCCSQICQQLRLHQMTMDWQWVVGMNSKILKTRHAFGGEALRQSERQVTARPPPRRHARTQHTCTRTPTVA